MTDEFDWTGFENTRNACEQPEQPDDKDEPELGTNVLRALGDETLGWVDSGSGPGYETPMPKPRLRPDRDKLS